MENGFLSRKPEPLERYKVKTITNYNRNIKKI
jgi:hypothetical protein